MERFYPGSPVDLVVLAAAPVANDVGTDLTQFPPSALEFDIRLDLTGSGTADFILYVRDSLGWVRAADAGNLGKIAGQTIPATEVFGSRINGLSGYTAVCLYKSVVTGAATVTSAKITPILRSGRA